MMENNSNERKGMPEIKMVVPVPSSGKFFRLWVEVLRSQHHLTDREMDLLAAFLKKRYALQRTILDASMIDDILMQSKSKKAIRKSVNISSAYFQRIMAKYRRNGILLKDSNIKERINPRYIPPLNDDDKNVGLLFMFLNPNDS